MVDTSNLLPECSFRLSKIQLILNLLIYFLDGFCLCYTYFKNERIVHVIKWSLSYHRVKPRTRQRLRQNYQPDGRGSYILMLVCVGQYFNEL